jgi:hypothetical protein
VLVLLLVTVIVTLIFRADVEAQSGAYATGVLVLILSAALAATLALWHERRYALSLYCGLLFLVFGFTLVDNSIERPDGLIIGGIFTVLLMVICAVSRSVRSMEIRIPYGFFVNAESWNLGPEVRGKKVHLVPIKTSSLEDRRRKRAEITRHFKVPGPFLFLHVHLLDNRSEFAAPLDVDLRKEGEDYVADVYGAVAIANTIAFVSETIDPISIFLSLTRLGLTGQAVRYLLFGEGETGLMVYAVLLRYWDWTEEEDVRPLIFLMSD